MHTAALHGHTEVLRILLDAGGNSSVMDNGGGQPIHEAAGGGHVECLELLCSRTADPNACDACGCTPLHRAASGGHVMAARWLIKVCFSQRERINMEETPGSGGSYSAPDDL